MVCHQSRCYCIIKRFGFYPQHVCCCNMRWHQDKRWQINLISYNISWILLCCLTGLRFLKVFHIIARLQHLSNFIKFFKRLSPQDLTGPILQRLYILKKTESPFNYKSLKINYILGRPRLFSNLAPQGWES